MSRLIIFFSLVITTPSYAGSANQRVKIHNRTNNFIDIEAQVDQLKIECSNGNPESGNYYMSLDVFDGHEVYSFFYRKPLSRVLCKDDEREFQKMLKGAKTFRLVGISPYEKQESLSKKRRVRISSTVAMVKWTNSFFARLQVEKKCKSYFPDECDLTNNYWANTIPNYQRPQLPKGQ